MESVGRDLFEYDRLERDRLALHLFIVLTKVTMRPSAGSLVIVSTIVEVRVSEHAREEDDGSAAVTASPMARRKRARIAALAECDNILGAGCG